MDKLELITNYWRAEGDMDIDKVLTFYSDDARMISPLMTLEGKDNIRTYYEKMADENEDLEAALGIGWYERGAGRRGYCKGKRLRTFTTRNGSHRIAMPRAAYFEPGPAGKREWNSKLIGRYARRSEEVEDALVRSYLCGMSTRRVREALRPLLDGAALSRSTVSQLVSRLSEQFDQWRRRDLSEEDVAVMFLDGFNLKLRLGGKVERVPVLSVLGVRTDGTRLVLALEVRTSESEAAWRAMTEDLAARGVKAPVLAVIDGNQGLHNAVKTSWPWIDVQRCTKHKLENLFTHAPKRLYDEIKHDYHAIVYAQSEAQARRAYARFEHKWQKDCPAVVKSLRETDEELLTFYRYPKSMWKMLRTTNCIERINEEFRRRVKTRGSLPNTDAALKILCGMCAIGLVAVRRIDAWRQLPAIVHAKRLKHGLVDPLDTAA